MYFRILWLFPSACISFKPNKDENEKRLQWGWDYYHHFGPCLILLRSPNTFLHKLNIKESQRVDDKKWWLVCNGRPQTLTVLPVESSLRKSVSTQSTLFLSLIFFYLLSFLSSELLWNGPVETSDLDTKVLSVFRQPQGKSTFFFLTRTNPHQ